MDKALFKFWGSSRTSQNMVTGSPDDRPAAAPGHDSNLLVGIGLERSTTLPLSTPATDQGLPEPFAGGFGNGIQTSVRPAGPSGAFMAFPSDRTEVQGQFNPGREHDTDDVSMQRAEPWHALSFIPGAENVPSSHSSNRHATHMYRDPVEVNSVSTAVIQSDSGYISKGRRTHSQYSRDLAYANQILAVEALDIPPLQQLAISPEDPRPGKRRRAQGHPPVQTRQSSIASEYICEGCGESHRLSSDWRKCLKRHEKPEKCPVPQCIKQSLGFATPNDLLRHIYCTHTDIRSWVCLSTRCKRKGKTFSRLDNLKSHMKQHHDEDVDALIQASQEDSDERFVAAYHRLNLDDPIEATIHRLVPSLPPVGPGTPSQSAHFALMNENNPQQNASIAPAFDEFNTTGGLLTQEFSLVPPRHSIGPIPEETLDADPPLDPTLNQFGNVDWSTFLGDYDENMGLPLEPAIADADFEDVEDDAATTTGTSAAHTFQPDPTPYEPLFARAESQSLEAFIRQTGQELATEVSGRLKVFRQKLQADHSATTETADRSVDLDVRDVSSATSFKQVARSETGPSLGSDPTERTLAPSTVDSDVEKKVAALVNAELLASGVKLQLLSDPSKGPMKVIPTYADLKCGDCGKTLPSSRELRKHRKRHRLRYGCTFWNCQKRFGTRNDWKRHEQSKHWQPEMWRCSQTLPMTDQDEPQCAKIFLRQDSYNDHLRWEHDIRDDNLIQGLTVSCRIGASFQDQYWCGFCQHIQTLSSEGEKAWDERLAHISSHIDSGDRTADQWTPLDLTGGGPGKDSKKGSHSHLKPEVVITPVADTIDRVGTAAIPETDRLAPSNMTGSISSASTDGYTSGSMSPEPSSSARELSVGLTASDTTSLLAAPEKNEKHHKAVIDQTPHRASAEETASNCRCNWSYDCPEHDRFVKCCGCLEVYDLKVHLFCQGCDNPHEFKECCSWEVKDAMLDG